MPRGLADELADRLRRLAIDFVLPSGPSMAEAVVLAEDLVAAGDEGPTTVALAALSRDALRRDAEEGVRQMLAEHDIVVPAVDSAEDEYRMLLHAFAFWGLPAHHFVLAFWRRLSDWDEQTLLDRELVLLLDVHESEGRPAESRVIEEQLRAAARAALARTATD